MQWEQPRFSSMFPGRRCCSAVGGVVATIVCIVLTLRKVGRETTRSLLTQTLSQDESNSTRKGKFITRFRIAVAFTLIGLVLLLASAFHLMPQVAGFFGAGLTLLVASLCYLSHWLRRGNRRTIQGTGFWSLSKLGFRNSTYRPSRTVLCVTLIASAAFIVVAVDAFRRSVLRSLTRSQEWLPLPPNHCCHFSRSKHTPLDANR